MCAEIDGSLNELWSELSYGKWLKSRECPRIAGLVGGKPDVSCDKCETPCGEYLELISGGEG